MPRPCPSSRQGVVGDGPCAVPRDPEGFACHFLKIGKSYKIKIIALLQILTNFSLTRLF